MFLALALLFAPLSVSARCYRCEHRNSAARHAFELATGHPYGWPGHVIDHVIPIACGGPDAPSNMQWQTIAAAKAKDRWERQTCHLAD